MSDLCPNCGVYIIRMRVMASGRGKQGGAAYQRLCVVSNQAVRRLKTMPALVTYGKAWNVGTDDFTLPSLFAVIVRLVW